MSATRIMIRRIIGVVVFIAVIAGLLFGCAGRWDLPFFWGYLGVRSARSVIGVLVADPDLIRERFLPGPGGQDFLTAVILLPCWLAQHVVAGLDVGRYHWSDSVPMAVQMIGLVAMAAAVVVQVWAVAVNRFFSSVIRIQQERGHHVITEGPYRYVRHPAYASWPFFIIGAGLALGSWLAALIGVVLVAPLLRRTALEDRILREQLEGYAAYAQKVRYRVLPGVW